MLKRKQCTPYYVFRITFRLLFEIPSFPYSSATYILCDLLASSQLSFHRLLNKGCELLEGEFGKAGSVIDWNYTLDGKDYFGKELVEEIDDEHKLVRFKVVEGDILNEFKSLTTVAQVIPKDEFSVVKCTIEFEKMNDDDGHYPTKLIDFMIKANKDIEAHHQQASA